MNPGGLSQVVFDTVTAGGVFEGWFGGMKTIPVAIAISTTINVIAMPAPSNFRE